MIVDLKAVLKKVRALVTNAENKLDEQILSSCKSSKTLFKSFRRPNNYLCQKSKLYHKWHQNDHAVKIHWAILFLYIVGIFGFLYVNFFNISVTKAASLTKTWSSTGDFNTGLNQNLTTNNDEVRLASTNENYSEVFSSTTYKDTGTTANWDTANQKVLLPGGQGPSESYAEDLNAIWNDPLGITDTAYDSINKQLYISGKSGRLVAYNLANGQLVNLTSKISSDWSTNDINAITFDSLNGYIYLGGTNGRFGALKTDANPSNGSWVYLHSRVSSLVLGATTVYDVVADPRNGYIYLSYNNSFRLGHYVGGNNPAAGTLTGFATYSGWPGGAPTKLEIDSRNNYLYYGGTSGRGLGAMILPKNNHFGLTAKLSGMTNTVGINSIAIDETNNVAYIAGSQGELVALTGIDNPLNSTPIMLKDNIAAGFGANNLSKMLYADGYLYIAGASGTLGAYSTVANPANGVFVNLRDKIQSFWLDTVTLRTLSYTDATNGLFVGGDSGNFSRLRTGYQSDKQVLSKKVNSTERPIASAILNKNDSVPAGTSINYYLSSDGGGSWAPVTSGEQINFSSASNDLRWRADLSTSNIALTSEITNMSIDYSYYNSSTGSLNLTLDSGQTAAWIQSDWTKASPVNSSISFKYRSADSMANLSSSVWSDSTASTPVNLLALGLQVNQWIEIQIDFASTNGITTPILNDISLDYVINNPPEIRNFTATNPLNGSKNMNISYEIKDSDTDSNSNLGYIGVAEISIFYSVDSGSTWESATLSSGGGNVSVNQVDFDHHSAVWSAGIDIPDSFFDNTLKLKIIANDHELALNTSELQTALFSIDTKNPVLGAIGNGFGVDINSGETWTNSPVVDLQLGAIDDNAISTQIRNDNNFTSNNYAAYQTSHANWTLPIGDGNKTVYVRFKDSYGNTTDASAASLFDTTPPGTPGNVRIYDTSDPSLERYSITLVWDQIAITDDFYRYVIERSTDNNTFSEIGIAQSTTFTDFEVSKGQHYYYRIKSLDVHQNYSPNSSTANFIATGQDTTAPVIPGGQETLNVADTSAQIAWSTNEPADSFAEYGKTFQLGQIYGKDELVLDHDVTLVGLEPATKYYYRLRSKDGANNLNISEQSFFTTTATSATPGKLNISGATAQKPGADPEEVTIIWTTDKPSTSQVMYGDKEYNLDLSSPLDSNLNTSHFIKLTKLKPNTKYFYYVASTDSNDQSFRGDINYFVTTESSNAMPSIADVEVSDITFSSAIISWKTSVVTSSIVEYGLDLNYGSKIEDVSGGTTTQHVVRIKDLEQGKTYHYRVLGLASNGLIISANVDSKFDTQTFPTIASINIKDIDSRGATITWNTNVESDSFIDYGVNELKDSQGRSDSVKEHAVSLSNLKSAASYQIKVKSRDKYGNLVESTIETFKTIVDSTAPIIKDLKSESSIVTDSNGESKAQVIVSWSTDEPSTSQIKYSIGVAAGDSYAHTTLEDSNLTTSHIVIISNLQVSSTYHMRVVGKDSSRNIGLSDDYTVLTLNQDKSLLQYMIQILEQRFSWVRGLGLFK